MCGAVEGAIIKAEPCPVEPALTLNTVTLNSMTAPSGSHATISTLCLLTGQPLTEASLLLPGSVSPPTISIQETPGLGGSSPPPPPLPPPSQPSFPSTPSVPPSPPPVTSSPPPDPR